MLLKKIKEAEDQYHEAIKIDPNDATPHLALADFYVSSNKMEEAVAEYKKASELNRNPSFQSRNLQSFI